MSADLTAPNEPQEVHLTASLGPLFPRWMAIYLAIPLLSVCWLLPLESTADQGSKLLAFLLGCGFLALLFLPKLGTIKINPNARKMTFRESSVAGALHFWKWREVREVSLPKGSKVVIGQWLDKNAFATLGIKRVTASGETDVLLEQRFAFGGATAFLISNTLKTLGGIDVETIRLNQEFKQVEWQPKPGKTNVASSLVLALGWAGFIAGFVTNNKETIFLVGAICLAVFLFLTHRQHARSQKQSLSILSFGLGTFQFVLLYVVLALLGSNLKH